MGICNIYILNSKIKKANLAIKNQIEELSQIDISNVAGWSNNTIQLIKIYFGENSEQFVYFKNLIFEHYYYYDQDRLLIQVTKYKEVLIGYLKSCQIFIESEGLFKPESEKHNFLGKIDNQTLWAIISVIVPLLFGIGYYIGSFQDKINKVNLLPQTTISQPSQPTDDSTKIVKNKNYNDNIHKR